MQETGATDKNVCFTVWVESGSQQGVSLTSEQESTRHSSHIASFPGGTAPSAHLRATRADVLLLVLLLP